MSCCRRRNCTGGFRVKTLSTQAGDLPLIPDWSIGYTPGTPGAARFPCYIVTEDLIEYHWLTDANPRVFQLGTDRDRCSRSWWW